MCVRQGAGLPAPPRPPRTRGGMQVRARRLGSTSSWAGAAVAGTWRSFWLVLASVTGSDQAHAEGPHRGCHEPKILRPVSWLRQEKREMHAPLWAHLPGAPLRLLRPADPASRRPCQPLPLGQPRPLPSAPPAPLSASGRGGGRGPEAAAAAAAAAVLVAARGLLGRSWLRT